MPLSPPVPREHLHTRTLDCLGYRRADGLWDIEGRLTDRKTYAFPNEFRGEIAAGEPLHDMAIRLTIDDDFLVRDIEVATDAGPFRACPEATPNFAIVKGLRIGPGWRRMLRERLGGVRGCTHQVEMLGALATVAFQTVHGARERQRRHEGGEGEAEADSAATTRRPPLLDSCHALASDGEVVKRLWPRFYTGD